MRKSAFHRMPGAPALGTVVTLLALALLLLAPREAAAYPQFQFSSGTNRCGQCHYAPAGTGLINDWGRSEAGDTISRGGDGAFLHGLWTPPSWVAIGGDLRLVSLANAAGGPESPELVSFPMQADLYAHFVLPQGLSVNLTAGDRGIVRPTDDSIGGRISSATDRFISREHYLMWRPSATGAYARLGRFFAPYGLRLVEHIFYVRRFTGNALYEEPYALSGGYLADDWEVHLTGFAPVPTSFPDQLQSIGYRESGGTAYGEKRFNNMAALALQGRVGIADEEARYQGGAVAKVWIEDIKLMFMGEADVIRQQIKNSVGQTQFVSFAGLTFIPIRGLMIMGAYERFHEDIALKNTAHNAYDLELTFFPWAHFELQGLGRVQENGDGSARLWVCSSSTTTYDDGEIQSAGDPDGDAVGSDAGRWVQPGAERGRQADVRSRCAADLHGSVYPVPRLSSAPRSDRRASDSPAGERALRRLRRHQLWR